MSIIDRRQSVALVVGTRGFFNPALVREVREGALAAIAKAGCEAVILPESATPNGAVESLDDAKKYARFFRSKQEEIDGIVICLPNFGDEIGIVETIKRSHLDVPVLVQASRDVIGKGSVAERRDSFCGKISVCNNLYQCGIAFTDTTEHTEDVDSALFAADLDRFARVCRIVRGVRGARIGAIGARPAAFRTVRYSEKLLEESGITVVPVDLSEILAAAEAIDAHTGEIDRMLEEISSYGSIPARIGRKTVVRQAKLSLAIRRWMTEQECDASAIQCWESVQKNYGCATCLVMSMMGEELIPSACEVDIAGAVSMYVLALASGKSPGFLDWNNNYGTERDLCVNTHCSNYPKSFMGSPIEISELDILGESLGRERCFGAVKGRVAPGEMTYFRLSTDDSRGIISTYLGEGEFTDDPFPMDGGIAVCRIPRLRELLRHIVKHGFEHHVAMVRGRWAGVIEEAIESYLPWDLYRHDG